MTDGPMASQPRRGMKWGRTGPAGEGQWQAEGPGHHTRQGAQSRLQTGAWHPEAWAEQWGVGLNLDKLRPESQQPRVLVKQGGRGQQSTWGWNRARRTGKHKKAGPQCPAQGGPSKVDWLWSVLYLVQYNLPSLGWQGLRGRCYTPYQGQALKLLATEANLWWNC